MSKKNANLEVSEDATVNRSSPKSTAIKKVTPKKSPNKKKGKKFTCFNKTNTNMDMYKL